MSGWNNDIWSIFILPAISHSHRPPSAILPAISHSPRTPTAILPTFHPLLHTLLTHHSLTHLENTREGEIKEHCLKSMVPTVYHSLSMVHPEVPLENVRR